MTTYCLKEFRARMKHNLINIDHNKNNVYSISMFPLARLKVFAMNAFGLQIDKNAMTEA